LSTGRQHRLALHLESLKNRVPRAPVRYDECMHEVIAIAVVALFLVLAVGVARFGLRMIGRGSDEEALRTSSLSLVASPTTSATAAPAAAPAAEPASAKNER
jgi:hypothetical protein